MAERLPEVVEAAGVGWVHTEENLRAAHKHCNLNRNQAQELYLSDDWIRCFKTLMSLVKTKHQFRDEVGHPMCDLAGAAMVASMDRSVLH